jgi:hypothetical protein
MREKKILTFPGFQDGGGIWIDEANSFQERTPHAWPRGWPLLCQWRLSDLARIVCFSNAHV